MSFASTYTGSDACANARNRPNLESSCRLESVACGTSEKIGPPAPSRCWTIITYNSDGTRVESTTGPTRTVMLKNGDVIGARDGSPRTRRARMCPIDCCATRRSLLA